MDNPVKPIKEKEASFVALEPGTDIVISKGSDVSMVISKAESSGKDFIISYEPSKDQTYIF